jgi:all-trans-retinol 13,14-reductase
VETDYLIVGSGLSALVFAALMANSGKKVQLLEAHEFAGGYGHTFAMGKHHKFNAQLHYVWNCGEGQTVSRVLKELGLDQAVTFEHFDARGFDHMRMPGYSLDIPYDSNLLIDRLSSLFPGSRESIRSFITEVNKTSQGLDALTSSNKTLEVIKNINPVASVLKYHRCTLQQVFDRFALPKEAQTLLALQWPDFMLPPDQLSFMAWVLLFTGYQRGAFYPTKHFEHVIDALVDVIEKQGGHILYRHQVENFIVHKTSVEGVRVRDLVSDQLKEYRAKTVICNMDPGKAADMIGRDKFSSRVNKRLQYGYSASNFMAYCTVKDIDLRDHGFGKWNIFHSGGKDLNAAFHDMYVNHDFSNPSFAMSTPGFLTTDDSDRPQGEQIIEFLTVANYDYFKNLYITDKPAYRQKKKQILNAIIDTVERHYVPNFRKYLAFKITGSPATNERFCWSPQGNSYGADLTPENFGPGRLNYKSSLKHFYFCNASSGYPGFAGAFWTGAHLYQELAGYKLAGIDSEGRQTR